MRSIIKNPITIWLSWLYKSIAIQFRNRKKHLKIGYLSKIENSSFGVYVTIYEHATVLNCTIGSFTFVASESRIFKTNIGKFCSIGPDCRIGLGRHPTDTFVSTHPIFFSTLRQSQVTFSDQDYFLEHEEIEIGNDVWIGAGTAIIDGVKIGNGAIIAAGSVVTKDVPPYAIVGGVPAKLIRYRFSEEQITRLLSDPWWDKEVDWLQREFKRFHNIDEYLSSRP